MILPHWLFFISVFGAFGMGVAVGLRWGESDLGKAK